VDQNRIGVRGQIRIGGYTEAWHRLRESILSKHFSLERPLKLMFSDLVEILKELDN
jgi:hypothetical protein